MLNFFNLEAQDDANNDPMYSEEQIVAAEFCVGARKLTKVDVDVMRHIAAAVFDILEKSARACILSS